MLPHFLRRLIPLQNPRTLTSLDAYDKWAASYPPRAHNALMRAEEAAMLRLLPDVAGASILDLACGTGRYGLIARERGAEPVLGLDNSPAMLAAAPLPLRALAATESLPLPAASVDGILCGLALGHLPQISPTFAEIARVLKPGGWALVSDFHPFIFLNGARRTFTAPDGSTYAVEHHLHLYADYHAASAAAGLLIDAVLEPRLGDDESVRFADDSTHPGTPVIIAYRFRRI